MGTAIRFPIFVGMTFRLITLHGNNRRRKEQKISLELEMRTTTTKHGHRSFVHSTNGFAIFSPSPILVLAATLLEYVKFFALLISFSSFAGCKCTISNMKEEKKYVYICVTTKQGQAPSPRIVLNGRANVATCPSLTFERETT